MGRRTPSSKFVPKDNFKDYNSIWLNFPEGFGLPRPSLILEYLKDLPPNGTILEIASGNGRYAIALASSLAQNLKKSNLEIQKPQITALEISTVGADLIRQRAIEQNLDLEIICGDFLQIDSENLENSSDKVQFDRIFSSGFLEEIEPCEQIPAVKKMLELTKPNGIIICKYCLFISGRIPKIRVSETLIPNYLKKLVQNSLIEIIQIETDPSIRFNGLSTIQDGQNHIRTQTIIIRKID